MDAFMSETPPVSRSGRKGDNVTDLTLLRAFARFDLCG
jgi:hypothetical protein